jgi:hypothetical protein
MNNRSSDHQSAVVITIQVIAAVVGYPRQMRLTNASNGQQQRKRVEMHGRYTPLPEGWRSWPSDAVSKQ